MKIINLFKLIICSVVLVSCAKSMGEKYEIKGTWENGEGQKVYLMIKDSITDTMVAIDSAVIGADKNFGFKGTVATMTQAKLNAGKQAIPLLLFNSQKPVQIEIISEKQKTLKKGETDSTEVTVNNIELIDADPELVTYKNGQNIIFGNSLLMLHGMFLMKEASEKGRSLDSARLLREEMQKSFKMKVAEYFDTTNNYRATTYLIRDYVLPQCSLEEAKKYWDNLTLQVKESQQGKDLLSAIEKVEKVNIGGVPDDFSLPTPTGEEISLYSLRGKIVLLDFWASWCRPCLAEVPNIKNIYEKYHDKGFEILGVSLDEEKDREKWIGAIEKNEMGWKHVSSLKGWDCPIANRFNVTGIPCMYIIDKEGKIIAKDLRGEELANKMDELFSTVK